MTLQYTGTNPHLETGYQISADTEVCVSLFLWGRSAASGGWLRREITPLLGNEGEGIPRSGPEETQN